MGMSLADPITAFLPSILEGCLPPHTYTRLNFSMRNMIISVCIIGLFLELSGLIWSAKKEAPSEAFVRLSAQPVRSIERPLEIGRAHV